LAAKYLRTGGAAFTISTAIMLLRSPSGLALPIAERSSTLPVASFYDANLVIVSLDIVVTVVEIGSCERDSGERNDAV
jgi:hypothetical protein